MSDNKSTAHWLPAIQQGDGPVYLAIAAALARDVQSGALHPGQRLPPQRILARAMGLDLTTISRAYTAARKSGLLEGRVGQGTYVRAHDPVALPDGQRDAIDLSMNMPPQFTDRQLARDMWSVFDGIERTEGISIFMQYQEPGGSVRDRTACADWLGQRLADPLPDRLLLCAGVQAALTAILSLVCAAGDVICCDDLSYPGFIAVARHLGLRLSPIAMDDDGMIPEDFERRCAADAPKAVYMVPTLHNPTTTTIPHDRRAEIAEIAQRYSVQIIEDDAYGALAPQAPPPMALFAPDLTWHISSLSKCLAPALRLAILMPPVPYSTSAVQKAIRATGAMVSPINARAATTWIETGTAKYIVAAIRNETRARQHMVRDILPGTKMADGAFHGWLLLPAQWSVAAFVSRLRNDGVSVVPSSAFSVGSAANAVRLGLGAATSMDALSKSLTIIAETLKDDPNQGWMVV